MPRRMTIAVAQAPQSADMGENLRVIAHFISLAGKARAGALVFPECALTGYGPQYHESSSTFDPDAIEAGVQEARDLARASGLALFIGCALPLEGGWANSLLCLQRGEAATRYDKLHLYGRDPEFYRAGRIMPSPVRAGGTRAGMQLCFDLRFAEPFRALAQAGAQWFAVAAFIHGKAGMWKGPVVAGHLRARASETGRFLAFANAAGAEQNVPSMILNPRGEIIAACKRGVPGLRHVAIDLNEVNDEMLDCRRDDLY